MRGDRGREERRTQEWILEEDSNLGLRVTGGSSVTCGPTPGSIDKG